MYSTKFFGVCTMTLVAMSLVGVLSISLEGMSLTSKLNHMGQPTLVWTQQGKRSHDSSVQLCGFRLVEAVRTLCRGNFVSTGYNRRSDPAMSALVDESTMMHHANPMNSEVVSESGNGLGLVDDSYFDMDNPYADFEMMWPQNTKSLALKVLGENKTHQRFRRSITDECCKKACTVSQMFKYCSRN